MDSKHRYFTFKPDDFIGSAPDSPPDNPAPVISGHGNG
jgi:hypothetical protein